MKKMTTLAAASFLVLFAGQTLAVPATVTRSAQETLGDEIIGVGSGDLVDNVFTYSITNTLDFDFGTLVIESTGVIDGNAGTSLTRNESCVDNRVGSITCSDIPIGQDEVLNVRGGAFTFDVTPGAVTNVSADFIQVGGGDMFTVTVSAVPIPTAAWLFGSALLGLVGIRRRN